MKVRSIALAAVALLTHLCRIRRRARAEGRPSQRPQPAAREQTLLENLANGMRELLRAAAPEISLPAIELKLPTLDREPALAAARRGARRARDTPRARARRARHPRCRGASSAAAAAGAARNTEVGVEPRHAAPLQQVLERHGPLLRERVARARPSSTSLSPSGSPARDEPRAPRRPPRTCRRRARAAALGARRTGRAASASNASRSAAGKRTGQRPVARERRGSRAAAARARTLRSTSSASARCVVSLPPTIEYSPRAARWRRTMCRRVIAPSAPRG